MAPVAKQGRPLIAEIDAAHPPPGSFVFWWMGQHSVVCRVGETTIYHDPYLADNPRRQTPPLLRAEEVTNADLVLCTHDHTDHIDPDAIPGIASASPQALFVAPRPTRERLLSLGVADSRLRLLGDGQSVEECGVLVTAFKARHEMFDEDPELGFPYLGYVVEGNGSAYCHTGDTLVYEGLLTTLSAWRLDALFVPINGRDAERLRRKCYGNMTFQEAVDLAGELDVGLAVPTHYDMFPGNTEDPRKFVDYLAVKFPHIPTWVGPAGERVTVGL